MKYKDLSFFLKFILKDAVLKKKVKSITVKICDWRENFTI